ncbi:MAG: pyruvate/2-oxoglutarate dehydrogenase complex, dihydrolipoamide acyltransferase (E2) component [uncultured archaeon A07HB70]|nr:MAG: pyruvate/2-oxoglutarate dehydrogenase complex, dihydrolipoamide acyltransferase (E2) component [uncultured archaeon A07HB70]
MTDVREFRLPDLGEGVADGEVVAWHVEPGSRVAEDDILAEVETDKALVEVPSPHDGVVTELCADEGEFLSVGSVLVRIETDGDGGETAASGASTAAAPDDPEPTEHRAAGSSGLRIPAPPSVRRLARERGVDLAGVDGSGSGGRVTAADVERAAGGAGGDEADSRATADAAQPTEPASAGGQASPGDPGGTSDDPPAERDDGSVPRERTLATPATRHLADERGVDIDRVRASETRDGEAYVTAAAVRAHAEGADDTAPADVGTERETEPAAPTPVEERDAAPSSGAGTTEAAAAAVEAAAATLDTEDGGPAGDVSGERVPYRGVRRSVGERMARSARTVPHATHHDSVDATRLAEVRGALADAVDAPLTYTAFVVRAVVDGLVEYPSLNARLDEDREEIVYRDEYNVGVAVATEAGLVVPVVEDADELDVPALAARVDDLASRARDRAVDASELRGGTFTVSNVGTVGGEYATPIVNHPEVAVLALGAVRERPRVVEGGVVARHTLPLSLSIDHRVVDGAEAAAFTNRVMERLREPARLLL